MVSLSHYESGFEIKSQLLLWICRLFLSSLIFSLLSVMNQFFSLSAIACMVCDKNLSELKLRFLPEKPWKYKAILKRFRISQILWTAKIMSPSESSCFNATIPFQTKKTVALLDTQTRVEHKRGKYILLSNMNTKFTLIWMSEKASQTGLNQFLCKVTLDYKHRNIKAVMQRFV